MDHGLNRAPVRLEPGREGFRRDQVVKRHIHQVAPLAVRAYPVAADYDPAGGTESRATLESVSC
jgi:hypothetical protein